MNAALSATLDFRRPAFVPMPSKLAWRRDVAVAFGPETRLRVACPDAAAAPWVRAHVEDWFGFSPRVETAAEAPAAARGGEGFALHAEPGLVSLGARTLRGAKSAAHALRQAVERVHGGLERRGWWLPALDAAGAPALPFRGLHLCLFPETPLLWVERMVRLAASYRYSHVVLEPWGTFRSERHPRLFWPEAPLGAAEARRLAALADDLGTTLVPAFNALGHAAGSRWASGKHCALDLHPELAPLFEPDAGWNWCLSNPDARAVVGEIVEEMHDAFGAPPLFHLGCDEAEAPTCPVCRAAPSWGALAGAHLRALCDRLAARGARAMVWHDMLLARDDPRWRGFVANGRGAEAGALLAALPRDVVVCDWHYGPPQSSAPTLDFFRARGFDVVACAWNDPAGLAAQARAARERALFGFLQTTWHDLSGAEAFRRIELGARAAWGEDPPDRPTGLPAAMAHWRQVGRDAGVAAYEETGFTPRQLS